jgi:16S rRNA (uracil1498-N3)-methyltransferase
MRTIRIYAPFENGLEGRRIIITGNAHHHMMHVLRLTHGQEVVVFNGTGNSFTAMIERMEKKSAQLTLLRALPCTPESPMQLHIAQGICKGDRMDFVIQKATELGATSITPIYSQRVHFKLDEDRAGKKYEHWQNVMISACEQSHRDTLPVLNQPIKLDAWLAQVNTDKRFILSPEAEAGFQPNDATGSVSLLIGPEGGLTPEEVNLAIECANFQSVRMGPRVLRTETAGLVALSILQYLGGDLK